MSIEDSFHQHGQRMMRSLSSKRHPGTSELMPFPRTARSAVFQRPANDRTAPLKPKDGLNGTALGSATRGAAPFALRSSRKMGAAFMAAPQNPSDLVLAQLLYSCR